MSVHGTKRTFVFRIPFGFSGNFGHHGAPSHSSVSVIAGAAYMTGTLIQLDWTARIIPARAAATVFATVMALTNFAGSGSEAFGGWLFEATKASYGRETAFSLVVAVSVAAAVSCWLLVPLLRRASPHWWD